MLISGTLLLIFSGFLLIVNQLYSDFYYRTNNLLLIALTLIAFSLSLFFYYRAGLFNSKKNNSPDKY